MLKKAIGALVALGLAAGLVGFVYALTNNKLVIGYNQGYQPDQPIPFSHKKHAGEYGMDCRYCHTSVAESRHSSVPSMNVCMNCHIVVKTDSPWIQKLSEAYYANKPVKWEKVHLLPDHVKFNHAAHINAAPKEVNSDGTKVAYDGTSFREQPQTQRCQTCHGQIQEMEVVQQWSSLSMGWCVNCHRQPENDAPVTCGTCHY